MMKRNMIKRTVAGFMCLAVFAAMPVVYAAEAENYEQETCEQEYCDCPVVFTYEEALELILGDMLVLQDMDITIRNLGLQRRFVNDALERIERGRTLEMHIMQDMLWQLESGISGARSAQQAAGAATGELLDELGLPPELAIILTPDMSGQISSMQSQRNELSNELNRMRRERNVAEMTRDARRNLNEFDRGVEILQLHRENTELTMSYVLHSMISGMAELERVAQLSEAGIELLEMNLHRMTIMYEVGMISTNALNAARHNLAQSRTQLDELNRSRQTLMRNLNYLMGQPLLQDTIIEFEREFPELPEDMEAFIAEILPEMQDVRLSQFDLDRAREDRWVYTGNQSNISVSATDRQRALDPAHRPHGSHDIWRTEMSDAEEEIQNIRNRITLQEAVERATTSHEQAIRSTESTLIRGFADFDNLVAQYDALHLDAEQAEADLEAVLTNYELGHVTQFEIAQARLSLFRIELDIESTASQKWMQAFRLSNPDLLQ